MTVLFMGSGPFGVPALERLADASVDLAVATVPDAPRGRRGQLHPTPIKTVAAGRGLPVIETDTLRREHGERVLRESGARLVIVADFRLMLPVRFLAGPDRFCYNLHGSLLPRWRGAAPIQHALLEGDTEFGVTLYQMVKALDAGPIVDVTSYTPTGAPDASEIEEQLSERAADLLMTWLETLLEGDVPLRQQDESEVTLAPKLEKSMGWIGWEHAAQSIERRVRALKPWPRTFSMLQSAGRDPCRVFVDRAETAGTGVADDPGTLVEVEENGLIVACGTDGTERVRLLRLQRAGKRSLPASDFCRGSSIAIGDRFTNGEGASG